MGGEDERLGEACEGGVGLEEDELSDVREELSPTDRENVELVAEENGVVDSSRVVTHAPAVEFAESGHGGVGVVVVRDVVERFGRGFP